METTTALYYKLSNALSEDARFTDHYGECDTDCYGHDVPAPSQGSIEFTANGKRVKVTVKDGFMGTTATVYRVARTGTVRKVREVLLWSEREYKMVEDDVKEALKPRAARKAK